MPQRQLPLPQLSLRVVLQVVQVAPPEPHSAVVRLVTQLSPLQQPLAHEVESHTQVPPAPQRVPLGQLVAVQVQVPPTHSWVLPHTVPVPQRQPPLVQVSARSASHVVQAPPLVPQVAGEAVRHWPLWQQPVGQEVASQTH